LRSRSQWIENLVRQIGWFILDPQRSVWPPTDLRNETNRNLIDKVTQLFLDALPKCAMDAALEDEFREEFVIVVAKLHELRRARNGILHSAYIELKACGEVHSLIRSHTRLSVDQETGEPIFDQELLSESSFEKEFELMGHLAIFLNRCHTQLIQRLPSGLPTTTST
jgi:hypothetical protein